MRSRADKTLGLRIFATAWLIYSAFGAPYIVREHFPAISLSESGSLNVVNYLDWSEDIFRGPRGGAYINNNPGASILAAAPLILLHPLLRRWDHIPTDGSRGRTGSLLRRAALEGRATYFLLIALVTVVLVMAPFTALMAAFLGVRIHQAGIPTRSAAAIALLCAFGTPVFFRTGYLNHNMMVGNAGFIAFLLLWDPEGRELMRDTVLGAGALAGFAVLCDFSGLVVMAALALYIYLRSQDSSHPRPFQMLAWYGLAAAPFLIGLLAYQTVAFGNFLRPSQHYMAPTAPTSQGYRGIDWPSPALLWANFFDPRFGLFAYCPILMAGCCSWWVRRVRYRVPRREQLMMLLYFGMFVLFCAANQYSWLQPSTGFRYLVPVVPGLLLLSVHVLQAVPKPVAYGLCAVSALGSWAMATARDNRMDAAIRNILEHGIALPWTRRLAELNLTASPNWVTAVVYVFLGVTIWWIWKPRLLPGPGGPSTLVQ